MHRLFGLFKKPAMIRHMAALLINWHPCYHQQNDGKPGIVNRSCSSAAPGAHYLTARPYRRPIPASTRAGSASPTLGTARLWRRFRDASKAELTRVSHTPRGGAGRRGQAAFAGLCTS